MKRVLTALIAFLMLIFAASCGETSTTPTETPKYDYDLANEEMSVQYQTSLEIQNNFEKYVGKTISLRGTYEENEWHFVVVQDVTLCCYAYFEIIADKYPAAGSEVVVTGTFDYYSDSAGTYPYIKVESLNVVET